MPHHPSPKDKYVSSFNGLFEKEFISGFSDRCRGNMSLNYSDTSSSLSNRDNFLKDLGIDSRRLVCAKQVHQSRVKRAQSKDSGCGALAYSTALDDTDAIITGENGLPIAVFTADCLSIFFYDAVNHAIGLAHAGWRSTHENIAVKTIAAMRDEFQTRPENVYVNFGPVIRSCCYEVGEEFLHKFPGAIVHRGKKIFLDLVGVNRRQLSQCGVRLTNIMDCSICTSCQSKKYFSYRKEGNSCGRIMSVMMLL
jgi:YfiH family protein